MVFVMRAEPTHIIISAQQMWNRYRGMAGDRLQLALDQCWRSRSNSKRKQTFLSFALCETSFPPAPSHQGHPDSLTPVLQPELRCFGAAQAPHRPTMDPNGSFQPQLCQTELSSNLKLGPFPPLTGTPSLSDSRGERRVARDFVLTLACSRQMLKKDRFHHGLKVCGLRSSCDILFLEMHQSQPILVLLICKLSHLKVLQTSWSSLSMKFSWLIKYSSSNLLSLNI